MGNPDVIELSFEPEGIVISRGTEEITSPRFIAYVWGQADEEPLQDAPEVCAA